MVRALVARGDEVRVVDTFEPRVHGDRPHAVVDGAKVVVGTVTDADVVARALEGVSAVIHLAAYQDHLPDFARFFAVNAVSTALIYERIVASRPPIERVVVASSQAVYGEGAYDCPTHGRFLAEPRDTRALAEGRYDVTCPICGAVAGYAALEESVSRPHASYGMSKRDQEEIAIALGRRYDIPSVALRYSIVQGAGQSFRNAYSGALRSFTVRALHGRAPVMFEDGEQLRDYVSVHDATRATLLALDDDRAIGRVFNVGGDRTTSVRELAGFVVDAAGVDLEPVAPGVYRVGDARHLVSDVSRLEALGWSPRVPQAEVVDEYVAWARAQPDLRDTYSEAESRMRELGVLRDAGAAVRLG